LEQLAVRAAVPILAGSEVHAAAAFAFRAVAEGAMSQEIFPPDLGVGGRGKRILFRDLRFLPFLFLPSLLRRPRQRARQDAAGNSEQKTHKVPSGESYNNRLPWSP